MSFALITGASKGIGRAIAIQFAKKGKNVLLVARNEELLQQVSTEIETTYKVNAPYLPADLSMDESAGQIIDWCKKNNYTVDVLVNNAGYGLSGAFEKHLLEEHMNMMRLNMNTVVRLTYLFLPFLKNQSKSYILNIASSAGYQATPFMGLYSASKSFVLLFSRALHHELKTTNVSVTCVSPGSTSTAFNDRAQIGQKARDLAKRVEMSPDAVARIAIEAMYKGKPEVIIGILNKIGVFLVWLLPKKMIERTAAKIYQ